MAQRPLYRDRHDAARAVVGALGALSGRRDLLVLGMPRGGVIVARAVADALAAPLDVIVARKLGVPGLPEVAFGAVAEGLQDATRDPVATYLGVPANVTSRIERRERAEVERRVRRYRGDRPPAEVEGRVVVLIDDGLATGATLRAAVLSLRARHPSRIVVAAPVGSAAGCGDLASLVDEVVVPATPEPFEMVSKWYDEFAPVSDDEVDRALRGESSGTPLRAAARDAAEEREVTVSLRAGHQALLADLGTAEDWMTPGSPPRGLVILAHGGGSSRQSYRNRYLAGCLRMAGWSTLRIDLLLPQEQLQDAESALHRFDVDTIADRLQCAVDWATGTSVPGAANVVLFGASTGAAAAAMAAVARPEVVRGVIARGGRVDLALPALPLLRTPILFIVGGADALTLRANRTAIRALRGDVTLRVVRGAGHTFEEPGAIGSVGTLAIDWLERRYSSGPGAAPAPWWRRLMRFAAGRSPVNVGGAFGANTGTGTSTEDSAGLRA